MGNGDGRIETEEAAAYVLRALRTIGFRGQRPSWDGESGTLVTLRRSEVGPDLALLREAIAELGPEFEDAATASPTDPNPDLESLAAALRETQEQERALSSRIGLFIEASVGLAYAKYMPDVDAELSPTQFVFDGTGGVAFSF